MGKPFNLPALRGKLGLDQEQMAERMGLAPQVYRELEAAPEKVQRFHALLAHIASLDVAIERGEPRLASTTIREKIIAWHQLQAAQASTA
jgi:transcriptional regulator with XRE-family HTH domain